MRVCSVTEGDRLYGQCHNHDRNVSGPLRFNHPAIHFETPSVRVCAVVCVRACLPYLCGRVFILCHYFHATL